MLINDDERLLDLAYFLKSLGARERISWKVNVWKYDTNKFFQPWSGQKKFKSLGLKGLQIIYPAWGAQISRGEPVVWHVTGKPWKYNASYFRALCIASNKVKWSEPWRKITKFCLSVFVLFMIYLARLWATQYITSNDTYISE